MVKLTVSVCVCACSLGSAGLPRELCFLSFEPGVWGVVLLRTLGVFDGPSPWLVLVVGWADLCEDQYTCLFDLVMHDFM